MAKLARFYGWTDAEVRGLEWDKAESYWQAITVLEAQEMLLALQASDFPWMKSENKESIHRQYHRLAYPKTYQAAEVLTTVELGQRIRAAMHG